MTPETSFEDRLAATADAVERRLGAFLDEIVRPGELARPPRLMAAMRHAVLGGGKRLRPFLAMAAARACGAEPQAALDAGCAFELVHCYSLVHDDLPAMDDDDLRRGRPTVHRAFDEATAILAGDALMTLAFELLTTPAAHPDPARRIELVAVLAQAAGLGGMAGGQMLDLAAEGRFHSDESPPLSPGEIRRLQAMKTGSLIAAAVLSGGIVAGAAAGPRAALAGYGRLAGAAFQIADDILDVEASAEAMGKATAKDAARGKATLVRSLGLEAARVERDRLAEGAVSALKEFGPEADDLRDAAWFMARRGF